MADRRSDHPIHSVFLDRWSPRAFDGSALTEADLLPLLEAARWAPSAFNAQPWRFYYALRGQSGWDRMLGLLVPGNQAWAAQAGALVIISSFSEVPGPDGPRPARTHSFDAGCAWGFLAVQATLAGLHTHGMAGFDRDRAKAELAFDEHEIAEAAVAVGRLGDPMSLPENLRAREVKSDRKPLAEVALRVD